MPLVLFFSRLGKTKLRLSIYCKGKWVDGRSGAFLILPLYANRSLRSPGRYAIISLQVVEEFEVLLGISRLLLLADGAYSKTPKISGSGRGQALTFVEVRVTIKIRNMRTACVRSRMATQR